MATTEQMRLLRVSLIHHYCPWFYVEGSVVDECRSWIHYTLTAFRCLQWCQGLFKFSQIQRRKQNMIALEETRTIDLDLQDQLVRVRHRPSVISLDRQGAREDLCLRMKYHPKSYLTGSLPAAWAQDLLVSFQPMHLSWSYSFWYRWRWRWNIWCRTAVCVQSWRRPRLQGSSICRRKAQRETTRSKPGLGWSTSERHVRHYKPPSTTHSLRPSTSLDHFLLLNIPGPYVSFWLAQWALHATAHNATT